MTRGKSSRFPISSCNHFTFNVIVEERVATALRLPLSWNAVPSNSCRSVWPVPQFLSGCLGDAGRTRSVLPLRIQHERHQPFNRESRSLLARHRVNGHRRRRYQTSQNRYSNSHVASYPETRHPTRNPAVRGREPAGGQREGTRCGTPGTSARRIIEAMGIPRLFGDAIVSVAVVSSMLLAASPVAAQNDAARAFRLDNSGHQDEAIALYRQVLARDSRSYDAHYGIARALDLKGNYAEAREHFAKAIELAGDDGSRDQALRMMGVSWTFVCDARQATPFFRRVFDRRLKASDFPGAAEEANEIGRVLLELGDVNGAQQWYRTGFDTSQRDPKQSASDRDVAAVRWAHAQARIAVRRGNRGEAQKQTAVVKSLLDKGTNPDQRIQYPYLTGYVAFYAKDYRRAVAELQQADQEDPFILLLTAEAYERVGDAARAREYYGKVLSSNSHAITNALARPIARRKLPER